MPGPEDIEDYEPRRPEVVDVDGIWVRAVFPDTVPQRGEALRIEGSDDRTAVASVREHLGARHVRALMPRPRPTLDPGASVERTERAAVIPAPEDRRLSLADLDAAVAGDPPPSTETFPFTWTRPPFETLVGLTGPLELGHPGADLLAPAAAGGLNLLIDETSTPETYRRFAERLAHASAPDATIWVDPPDGTETADGDWVVRSGARADSRAVALQIAACLCTDRRNRGRDVFVAGTLPALRRSAGSEKEIAAGTSFGELVDLVGTAMASTESGACTVALRLPLAESDAGLSSIVETLDIGDVDAQIAVDADGRFRPRRSLSDVEPGGDRTDERGRVMTALRRASRAEQKREIFGRRELTDREEAALDRVDALTTPLVSELDQPAG